MPIGSKRKLSTELTEGEEKEGRNQKIKTAKRKKEPVVFLQLGW
jgi:hypothetical protein